MVPRLPGLHVAGTKIAFEHYIMRRLLLYFAVFTANAAFSQKVSEPCCTIIDVQKEAGTFTIRDKGTGRIQLFKPDALEGAELKVGDTIDADFDLKRITSVKGITRSYELLDASPLDSCCVILKIDTAENSNSLVTARNNSTGEKIRFSLPKMLASRLTEGNMVFTQPSHGYAMIIGKMEDDTTKTFLFGFPLLQESDGQIK
jgi:hypothetical protein